MLYKVMGGVLLSAGQKYAPAAAGGRSSSEPILSARSAAPFAVGDPCRRSTAGAPAAGTPTALSQLCGVFKKFLMPYKKHINSPYLS